MILTVTAEALFDKLQHVRLGGTTCLYPLEKCRELAPLINEINALKIEKQAVILAHSYVSPEIVYGVADFTGDSYGLSKDAKKSSAKIIVFVAVRFMGETAKILCPDKEVLIPSEPNGCTLADSITGEEVRQLRAKFPGHTFVCYINTTADVKAECDVCVTSSNVNDIIERIPNDKIFFLPDKLMGKNLREEMTKRGLKKEIELHHGTCYVHEEYDADMIVYLRQQYPGLKVLSHPECSPGVVHQSDYVGSTTQLLEFMKKSDAQTVLMLTECGITSRLQVEMPHIKFVGSCSLCRFMKANTLQDILKVLKNPEEKNRIKLDETVRLRALRTLDAMFDYAERR